MLHRTSKHPSDNNGTESSELKIRFMYSRNPHKKPVFIRILRLKSNLLNPLSKNPPEAETRRGSYVADFIRIHQNFQEFLHSNQNS